MTAYDTNRFNYCNNLNNIVGNYYRTQEQNINERYISSIRLQENCRILSIPYRDFVKNKPFKTIKHKKYYLKSDVYPFLKKK